MELPGDVSNLPEQRGLHVHVKVFQVLPPLERIVLYVLPDGDEAINDKLSLLHGDDALLLQHSSVGYGPGHVLPVQPPVIGE